ncbi:hypothetical protein QTL95_03655 [Rhizobium sp. S152]|nr:hypothetical protein [Rhizobium sp. S152]MDM9624979.1 hypothetical protein [Rhizobium sp. S152]
MHQQRKPFIVEIRKKRPAVKKRAQCAAPATVNTEARTGAEAQV